MMGYGDITPSKSRSIWAAVCDVVVSNKKYIFGLYLIPGTKLLKLLGISELMRVIILSFVMLMM